MIKSLTRHPIIFDAAQALGVAAVMTLGVAGFALVVYCFFQIS